MKKKYESYRGHFNDEKELPSGWKLRYYWETNSQRSFKQFMWTTPDGQIFRSRPKLREWFEQRGGGSSRSSAVGFSSPALPSNMLRLTAVGGKRKAPMPLAPAPLKIKLPVNQAPSQGLLVVFGQGKGGEGKSTLVRELVASYALLHPDRNYCIVDLDPQCHQAWAINSQDFSREDGGMHEGSRFLSCFPRLMGCVVCGEAGGLYDILKLPTSATETTIKQRLANVAHDTYTPNVKCFIARPDEMRELEEKIKVNRATFTITFRRICNVLKSQYDTVFFDTQGSLSTFTPRTECAHMACDCLHPVVFFLRGATANQALQLALMHSNALIMPVNPKDPWSVSEFYNTAQAAADGKMACNYPPPMIGFVANKIEAKTLSDTLDKQVETLSNKLEQDEIVPEGNVSFVGRIRSSPGVLKEAVEHGPPLAVRSNAAAAPLLDDLTTTATGLDIFLGTIDRVPAFK